ncbi:carbohydrate ABC transporter substrate-binding protein, CUT1 family [Micromonospora rhizosphaerae]|uniref:Carbohydrate ABC transporter substrate-binding protein, CUT1 family n=1 Tax=Micromonospora rhizosphaerae TaxID=568872 RepID=A0A1C6SYS3_9ACTN|nr:ABC transporter substrate-binding protein [Micromonospora rhizosphaerae]SCL34648.1 carbohydrate ABC transporter substrate-binding protein, CUT1 family [Micromonospora rhizosphaerae]
MAIPRSPASAQLSRRDVLRWGLALGAAAPLLSACGGVSTSGGGGDGALTFLSTQFTPVEEAERVRGILKDAYPGRVSYVVGDSSQAGTQVRSQVSSGDVRINLLGGLHGDFTPLAGDNLEDLSDLMRELSDKGYSSNLQELAKAGTDRTWYIPWAQATYLLAVKKSALEHLPSGADVKALTYDQYLDWAIAARRANGGKAQFGLPAGPKGLLHRFLQGHLYPSYTGALVTAFRSDDAVTMWKYLKELWANTTPASTNFDFMQEPLAAGQVTVAWDHAARLVGAPQAAPDDWMMVPAPAGPKGRGYMTVVLGLGIPKGAPHADKAKDVIKALSQPKTQIELLRQNAFFPTVKAEIPADLPPAIRLEADAVRAQQEAPNGILSLPPVGLGKRDGEMSKIFRDAFTAIVLEGADVRRTLDSQAKNMKTILDEVKVPCWAPDPVVPGQTCAVG